MTENAITEPDHIKEIKKLQGFLAHVLGPGGRDWTEVHPVLLDILDRGALRKYELTTDARARFLCGETDFFSIDFGFGRYRLKILIIDDRTVRIDTLDRKTGRPMEFQFVGRVPELVK